MIHRRGFLRTASLALAACALPLPRARADQGSMPEPRDGFGPETTARQVIAGLDLSGRTLLVTGATSGIGRELTRVLVAARAHVIATARTADAGRELEADLPGCVTVVPLDLADFDSVRACAARIRGLAASLDGLACNAGIVLDRWETVDGIEKSFVVNHVGHFLLVNELLPRVLAADAGRVVVLGPRKVDAIDPAIRAQHKANNGR